MKRQLWNHNIHYYGKVVTAAPKPCRRVLDVGCGRGLLIRDLLDVSEEVFGIDPDPQCIEFTRKAFAGNSRIVLVEGDVMRWPFAAASFDMIAAVATLHHLPLLPALIRFRELLSPGGVLTVIGMARPSSLGDYLAATAAIPVHHALKRLKSEIEVNAPTMPPRQTLSEIRAAAANILPSSNVKRLLLFRYILMWRKPNTGSHQP